MHAGLLVALVGIVALSALGVTIPLAIVFLVLLACPLMMILMMSGEHGHGENQVPPPADHAYPSKAS
ncbi:MAG: DUF2933 domain-containing protein [Actinobacteria bacterium]|nr:DUF2933 domain-containing protein [Actinomycetota bacterium]